MTEQEKIQRMIDIYHLMCKYLSYQEYMTTGCYDEDSDDYDKLHDICYQFSINTDIPTLREKVFGPEFKDTDMLEEDEYWDNDATIFGWCCAIVAKEELYMQFGNDELQSAYNKVTVKGIFSDNALERIETALKIFAESIKNEDIYTAGVYYSTVDDEISSWQKFKLPIAIYYNNRLVKHSVDEMKQSFENKVDNNNILTASSMFRVDNDKMIFTAVVIKKDYTVEIVDLFDEPLPAIEYED
jgi:hypothetical protein